MAGVQGDSGMSIEFLLTTPVIVASPGTGAIYTLAAGLSGGVRASLVAAFGCTIGIVPHMIAAISGLAALLHTSAEAFQILKWLGVAYLLYMAWSMSRERGVLRINGADREKRPAGDRFSHPNQPTQPETLDFLFCFPASVLGS